MIKQKFIDLHPDALLFLGVIATILLYLPFFVLGQASFIPIGDNLDSEFIYLEMLKQSGGLLSLDGSKIVPNVFNGLPRSYFHSEFSFIRVLFYCLPSFWAYVANSLIVRMVGFVGIMVLARDYFPAKGRETGIFLIALIFALLPVYSMYGLSVLGQPLLLWAFLNLKHGAKIILSFLVISLFPFYSHFVMIAPFCLVTIGLYGVYDSFSKRKVTNIWYWVGLGVLFLLFLLANFNLLLGFFSNSIPSHREEMVASSLSLFLMIKKAAGTFLLGRYHSSVINSIPILALAAYAFYSKSTRRTSLLILISTIGAIAVLNGVYDFLVNEFQDIIPLLNKFRFKRFTFLIPFLYFLVLLLVNQEEKVKNAVFYSLVTLLLASTIYSNTEMTANYGKCLSLIKEKMLPSKEVKTPALSFESFFSEQLFKKISDHIQAPKQDFRVISVGIHPSISQYNGFYTLDGYQNYYPLSYKTNFREVIAGELEKDAQLKTYFDDWGSRCYVFSAELDKSCKVFCRKTDEIQIKNLSINIEKVRQMGGRYIFSAVPISNSEELTINLEKEFRDEHSLWKIYLYRV